MSLFRLDASIFPASSASRALGDIVESEWLARHRDDEIVRRDLSTHPVAADAWPAAVIAKHTPEGSRTDAQRAAVAEAGAIADQLTDADALLFAVPLYNFGVSQHFKAWFDLAYTDPRIDPQGTALRGKPAVLVTVLGGNYGEGTPKEGWDHSTGWLRRVLEDVWGLDLTVVQRQFTLVGVNPALDQFADIAADLKTAAEAQAHVAGRALAEAVAERAAA
ncbi:MAG: NAD(P)H-dependent oxidoreductase [Microbacterium sp.]|nr:NAD(P)H-dependent oxidoreductase [Microbacterium sp.]